MSMLTIQLMAKRNNRPTYFELIGKPIKPCPWCYGTDISVDEELKSEELIRLICNACGACSAYRDSRINAIKVWQQRKNINKGDL